MARKRITTAEMARLKRLEESRATAPPEPTAEAMAAPVQGWDPVCFACRGRARYCCICSVINTRTNSEMESCA